MFDMSNHSCSFGSTLSRRVSLRLVFVLLVVALLAALAPTPQPAAAQGDQGRIAYDSTVSGNYDIWTMNPDGSDRRNVTNSDEDEWNPTWSPDGSRIAFVSDRNGNWDVYVMNSDGSNLTQLTDNPDNDGEPAWSPDGSRIAFVSGRDGNGEIYIMNTDGSGQVNITNSPEGSDRSPAWSPDGSRIAFHSDRDNFWKDIFVMDADGSNQTNITNNSTTQEYPTWSPDGSVIAFAATSENGEYQSNTELLGMNMNTGELFQILNPGPNGAVRSPTFSPDGSLIAVAYNANHNPMQLIGGLWDVCVGPVGSGGCIALTVDTPLPDENPDWWWPQRTAPAPTNPAPAPAPEQPTGNERCFEATGYCIDGRIREYWEQNGGLEVFGLPITPLQTETIEGQAIQVQWFERNRLELHPENAAPYDVLLGRLGADRLAQQGYDWQSVPPEEAQDGCRYFEETGRNVCGDILAAWRADGLELDGRPGFTEAENLALFGLPLTGLMTETLSDGNDYQVQYFERARFELHPQNEPPFNVLLGLLGREVRASSN
jgi:Tol biopolymer transport system component